MNAWEDFIITYVPLVLVVVVLLFTLAYFNVFKTVTSQESSKQCFSANIHYGDRVEVVAGFYSGQEGTVVGENDDSFTVHQKPLMPIILDNFFYFNVSKPFVMKQVTC